MIHVGLTQQVNLLIITSQETLVGIQKKRTISVGIITKKIKTKIAAVLKKYNDAAHKPLGSIRGI